MGVANKGDKKRGEKRGREGGPAEPASRPRFSRVDEETATYFSEIAKHLETLDDEGDRELLAENVLGEAAGKEALVASDAACSRVVERLIPYAGTAALIAFLEACTEGENLGAVCTRWACRRPAAAAAAAAVAARVRQTVPWQPLPSL